MPYIKYVLSPPFAHIFKCANIRIASRHPGPHTPQRRRYVFSPYATPNSPNSASQLANWLEFYADAMELNVWTSSTATQATRNPKTGKWDVTVKRDDGTERVFHVDHVVYALGLGAGKPNIPQIPGRVRLPVLGREIGAHAVCRRSSRGRCCTRHRTAARRIILGRRLSLSERVLQVRSRLLCHTETVVNEIYQRTTFARIMLSTALVRRDNLGIYFEALNDPKMLLCTNAALPTS